MIAEKISQPLSHCEDNYIHEDQVHRAQADLIDGLTATRLAQAFQALSDPSRIRIISALVVTELCVCDLAAVLGMSQSAVSHQLKTLRDLRLVKSHKEGRVVYYSLQDEHIRDLFERGLAHMHEEG
jgi:ArsR family transcriptional regulator